LVKEFHHHPCPALETDGRCGVYHHRPLVCRSMGIPTEDLRSIARILAAGYLRLRDQLRQETQLANSATSSRHGHEVNSHENGEQRGDRDAERD
jgi:Fe-S-cluster containining protein